MTSGRDLALVEATLVCQEPATCRAGAGYHRVPSGTVGLHGLIRVCGGFTNLPFQSASMLVGFSCTSDTQPIAGPSVVTPTPIRALLVSQRRMPVRSIRSARGVDDTEESHSRDKRMLHSRPAVNSLGSLLGERFATDSIHSPCLCRAQRAAPRGSQRRVRFAAPVAASLMECSVSTVVR